MLYTLPWSRFELTTSVVIGTDYIGSCKSNYHTIMATTAPTTDLFLALIEMDEIEQDKSADVLKKKKEKKKMSESLIVVYFSFIR